MPHIATLTGIPGIRSLAMFRPETGKHLYALAQALLRGDSPLSPAERELIAAHVSARNNCLFCTLSHAAAARVLFKERRHIVDGVLDNVVDAPVSPKLKALLNIAGKVQRSGRDVTNKDITEARRCGANDRDIHDTVLIAATFSLFNRYVDGLATLTPTDSGTYEEMGERLATLGYNPPKP